MECRTLGRTGIDVGVVGVGTEYLLGPRETTIAVAREAIDHGANYFDLLMGDPDYREAFGAAFREGYRERAVIAGHLGTLFTEAGQVWQSRDVALCEQNYHDCLTRLGTDYLDVVMLQFVDEEADYAQVTGPGGLLELAQRLKQQGKARCIGMSSHMAPAPLQAVESGVIDVLMFPVNPAFDVLPGYNPRFDGLWEDAAGVDVRAGAGDGPSRKDLYRACAQHEVAVIGMKPYAAGWLIDPARCPGQPLTPVQCLSYALSQPAVSTVVPGVKTLDELRAALHYLDATPEERDFSAAIAGSRWRLTGACMYCNHCMPCPSGLDIAATNRLIDAARRGITPALREQYYALPCNASHCVACGTCATICPFGVDVAENMRLGVALFG